MRLLIHDLDKDEFEKNFSNLGEDIKVISNNDDIKNCIGCFGCWIKTPGKCVLKDTYNNIGELIASSDEVIIISKCYYGGYSPFVKNVLDRSISYVHPYFVIRNNEMHHKLRYKKDISLKSYFYEKDITEEEKEVAKELIKGNALNFGAKSISTFFVNEISELGGVL